MENNDILIIGGGIAGMGAALALSRSGHGVQLFEKTVPVSGVLGSSAHDLGFGLQLAPNAMRQLYAWGLESELNEVVSWPERLRVRHAKTGRDLASMRLDPDMQVRYGAPYASVHRADLQRVMLQALRSRGVEPSGQVTARNSENPRAQYGKSVSVQSVPQLHLGMPIEHFQCDRSRVALQNSEGLKWHGKLLIGADGIWSPTRAGSLNDNAPEFTGLIAHRACFTQNAIPQRMRRHDVELWLGNAMHIVTYPVRHGTMLNVVLIPHATVSAAQIQQARQQDNQEENQLENQLTSPASILKNADMCSELRDLMLAVTHQKYWQAWPLFEREPLSSSAQMMPLPASPLVLIGDASHPMRPHLAQGAGMAIEDAAALAKALKAFSHSSTIDPRALDSFVHERVARVQKVQKKSLQMGKIYRATGFVGASRNLALRLFGRALLRQHWLYKERA